MEATEPRLRRDDDYAAFRALDGAHALRRAVPHGYVDYHAHPMPGSQVVYFNYELAREMGLISASHPDRMTRGLRQALVDTFAIRIVNEQHARRDPGAHRGARGPYMATRYLQMQHPGRTGRTSGDGRGIWLGSVTSDRGAWDVSACGTGSTRLCPATAWTGRHYKTGSRVAAYGCGTASVFEGVIAALQSASFRRNGIGTERVLAVMGLPDGLGVTVRAYPSLLRPAHFLVWLRQRDLRALRGVAELFWNRHASRGAFPPIGGGARWHHLARWVATSFARAAATYESEYVFCWLDWDGDNVLMDGSVLDYGSVRQFGLFHREYRYDDGPIWSTTIPEQRRKARTIVQNFAQIRDALLGRPLRPLREYRHDPVVRRFEREFETHRLRLLLRGAGFDERSARALLSGSRPLVERFRREHRWFERASKRRRRAVADGITRDAVYSTRDILRELPVRYLVAPVPIGAGDFLEIAASTYAARADRKPTPSRAARARRFQRLYLALIHEAARRTGATPRSTLRGVARRSAVVNRFARLTGDSAIDAARRLARTWRRLGCDGVHAVLHRLVEEHATLPAPRRDRRAIPEVGGPVASRALRVIRESVSTHRHGL